MYVWILAGCLGKNFQFTFSFVINWSTLMYGITTSHVVVLPVTVVTHQSGHLPPLSNTGMAGKSVQVANHTVWLVVVGSVVNLVRDSTCCGYPTYTKPQRFEVGGMLYASEGGCQNNSHKYLWADEVTTEA